MFSILADTKISQKQLYFDESAKLSAGLSHRR